MTDARRIPAGLELRYDCDTSALPPELRSRFARLELGDAGHAFVGRAMSTRPGRARTALQRALRTVMSDFDANGLLGMYPMHLLGTEQWRSLLPWAVGALHLDVGAGSGDVTRTLSPLSAETVTTETSKVMARNLRRRGFRCFEADLARSELPDPPYGLITCLNVIDRCVRPVTLLERLSAGLAPGGTLVLATPFPFDPFVYDGPRSLDPEERLDIGASGPQTWEQSVASLAVHVQTHLGLRVETVSRVPYLCQGDADQPLYVLDDALLVCRKLDTAPGHDHPSGRRPTEKSGQSR